MERNGSTAVENHRRKGGANLGSTGRAFELSYVFSCLLWQIDSIRSCSCPTEEKRHDWAKMKCLVNPELRARPGRSRLDDYQLCAPSHWAIRREKEERKEEKKARRLKSLWEIKAREFLVGD